MRQGGRGRKHKGCIIELARYSQENTASGLVTREHLQRGWGNHRTSVLPLGKEKVYFWPAEGNRIHLLTPSLVFDKRLPLRLWVVVPSLLGLFGDVSSPSSELERNLGSEGLGGIIVFVAWSLGLDAWSFCGSCCSRYDGAELEPGPHLGRH